MVPHWNVQILLRNAKQMGQLVNTFILYFTYIVSDKRLQGKYCVHVNNWQQ